MRITNQFIAFSPTNQSSANLTTLVCDFEGAIASDKHIGYKMQVNKRNREGVVASLYDI